MELRRGDSRVCGGNDDVVDDFFRVLLFFVTINMIDASDYVRYIENQR